MSKQSKGVSPAQRRKARQYAVQALYQWQLTGASLTEIEMEFMEDNDMKSVDVGYFSELVHKVPAMLAELDAILEGCLDRGKDDHTPVELSILRLAAYELKERIDVPYKVVINEAVDLSKRFGAADAHKYVNGVLDKLARQLRPAETG